MKGARLLAVDPSLTCSGWALFMVERGVLAAVGKVRSLPAQQAMAVRLADLQSKIGLLFDHLELGAGDVVLCEEQTTMRDPRAAFKVEQVRGMFEALARSRAADVPGRINPRSVQFEIMGLKGQQLPREQVKAMARHVVATTHGMALRELGVADGAEELKPHQDIVDAVLVGALGLTRIASAQQVGATLGEYFDQCVRSRARGSGGRGLRW